MPRMRPSQKLWILFTAIALSAAPRPLQAEEGRARIFLPLASSGADWPLAGSASTAAPVDGSATPAATSAPVDGTPTPVATWTPVPVAATPAPSATPNPGGSAPTPTLGAPITVPEDKLESWVYVSVPGTECGNGSPSGLAVNLTKRSSKVLIYFEGGGGCWDDATCFVGNTAQNLNGISEAQLMQYISQGGLGKGIFARGDALNPFADSSFVYVPYCTGDFHLGGQVTRYTTGSVHHVGWLNVDHYLARIVPTFASATQIALAGYSAGGLGVLGNTLHVANAFKPVNPLPPIVVDDAGPILRDKWLSQKGQATIRGVWGLTNTLETVCPSCNPADGDYTAWRVTASALPGARISLVSSYGDQTVRQFYSLLNGATLLDVAFGRNLMDAATFEAGLRDLATWAGGWQAEVPASAVRFFFYPGTRHGATTTGALSATSGLAEFLQAEVRGDAGWSNVIP